MNADAIAHFKRLGRALADTHAPESPPKDFRELVLRMKAIDPDCGLGTEDPFGGDWDSHLAYLRNRQNLIEQKKRGRSS